MATFYVDSAADAGGDGTTSATTGAHCAWDTIADVNAATFAAGDSVLFCRGCTWREQLTVPSSGSVGLPITFGAYGTGADPIIDGADLITPGTSWAQSTGPYNVGQTGTTTTGRAQNYIYYHGPLTPSSSGTLLSYTTRVGARALTAAMKCALYSDNGSGTAPNALIANTSSEELASGGPNAWITFNVASGASLTAGTKYWAAYWYNTQVADGDFGSNAGAGGASSGPQQQSLAYGAWPGTAAPTFTRSDDAGGFYVTINSTLATTWQTAATTEPKQVFFDGVRGNKVASIALVDSDKDWFWESNVLYVYSASDPDTAYTSPGIEPSQRSRCIYGSQKSYISISGIQCKRANGMGIENVQGNNWIVDSVNSNNHVRIGVAHYYYDGNSVNSCQVTNGTYATNGETGIYIGGVGINGSITNNLVYDNCWNTDYTSTAGIRLWSADQTSVAGWAVEHNTVYGNGDGTESRGSGIWLDTVNSNIVRYNLVHDNHYPGIQAEKSCSNQIYYNIVYNHTDAHSAISGVGLGLYKWDETLDLDSNVFYNNVIYNSIVGIDLSNSVADGSFDNNLFKNNIVDTITDHELRYYDAGSGTGNVFLYNCLDVEPLKIEWQTVSKTTYDAWETAYGGTTSSVEADPLFISATDFHLQSSSPCINAGTDVSLTSDYDGQLVPQRVNPDIGAYEFAGNYGRRKASISRGGGIRFKY